MEEECKTLQVANTTLRHTTDTLQQEIAQLKIQLEKPKTRPPAVFEKMIEELRENLSHEIKEKERWKRYYIESSEEMEELKEELEREEKRESRLRKVSKLFISLSNRF
jgi:predicted RNase H-like nuclease (RuvC/YqgF family)